MVTVAIGTGKASWQDGSRTSATTYVDLELPQIHHFCTQNTDLVLKEFWIGSDVEASIRLCRSQAELELASRSSRSIQSIRPGDAASSRPNSLPRRYLAFNICQSSSQTEEHPFVRALRLRQNSTLLQTTLWVGTAIAHLYCREQGHCALPLDSCRCFRRPCTY